MAAFFSQKVCGFCFAFFFFSAVRPFQAFVSTHFDVATARKCSRACHHSGAWDLEGPAAVPRSAPSQRVGSCVLCVFSWGDWQGKEANRRRSVPWSIKHLCSSQLCQHQPEVQRLRSCVAELPDLGGNPKRIFSWSWGGAWASELSS